MRGHRVGSGGPRALAGARVRRPAGGREDLAAEALALLDRFAALELRR